MAETAAKFVKIVEKYPCLYNNSLAEYARKDITEKAWSDVAKEIKWSVNESKEKWKNMRNGFVRSLKPKASGSARKYYLHNEMQFVLSFIKPGILVEERGSVPSPQESTQNHEPASPEGHDDDAGCNWSTAEEIDLENVSQVERPSKNVNMKMEVDKYFENWLKRRKPNEDDPRRMFVLSLLPDVQSLTDEQMSAFRIKVLMLLEEIKKSTPAVTPHSLSNKYRDFKARSATQSQLDDFEDFQINLPQNSIKCEYDSA